MTEEATIAGAVKVDENAVAEATAESKTVEPEVEGVSKDQNPEAKEVVAPEAKVDVPPDTYELDVPDYIPLDEKGREQMLEHFRAANLTQAQATAVFKLYSDNVKDVQDTLATQKAGWLDEVRKDPVLGGSKFASTVVNVERATLAYADESFQTLMNETGMGNHPALLRFLNKVGLALREDNAGGGTPQSKPQKRELHELLYNQIDVEQPS